MFDFENLKVYNKYKTFNAGIRQLRKEAKCNPTATNNQLKRTSFSIPSNSYLYKKYVSCKRFDYV